MLCALELGKHLKTWLRRLFLTGVSVASKSSLQKNEGISGHLQLNIELTPRTLVQAKGSPVACPLKPSQGALDVVTFLYKGTPLCPRSLTTHVPDYLLTDGPRAAQALTPSLGLMQILHCTLGTDPSSTVLMTLLPKD